MVCVVHIKAFEGNFLHEEVSIIQALCKSSLGNKKGAT